MVCLCIISIQDNHILATIRNNQRKNYLPLLKEHGVYSIFDFKVVPGPALYRTVDRDLAIKFSYKTKIEQKEDTSDIPLYKFELQSFDKVKYLVGHVTCLIGQSFHLQYLVHNKLRNSQISGLHKPFSVRCDGNATQSWPVGPDLDNGCRPHQRQVRIPLQLLVTKFYKN